MDNVPEQNKEQPASKLPTTSQAKKDSQESRIDEAIQRWVRWYAENTKDGKNRVRKNNTRLYQSKLQMNGLNRFDARRVLYGKIERVVARGLAR